MNNLIPYTDLIHTWISNIKITAGYVFRECVVMSLLKYICLIIGKIDSQRHTATKNIRTYIFSTYFRKYLPRFGIVASSA